MTIIIYLSIFLGVLFILIATAILFNYIKIYSLEKKVSEIAKEENVKWEFWSNPSKIGLYTFYPDRLLTSNDSPRILIEKNKLISYSHKSRKWFIKLFLVFCAVFGADILLVVYNVIAYNK
jgi:hypothetical protein